MPLRAAATQRSLLHLLDICCDLGLPTGPLEDSCLKAIARWQVISTVAAISGLLFRSHAPTITLKAMLHLPPAGNSCTTVPIACMHMLGARHVQRPPQLQLGTAARHLQVVLSPGIMRMVQGMSVTTMHVWVC